MLEEVCKQKDSTLSSLKQELHSMESKVISIVLLLQRPHTFL
jgi:hypothetical protein